MPDSSTAPALDLDRLEKLATVATAGPWSTSSSNSDRKPHYPDNGAIWVFANGDCETHPIADCSCNHTCRFSYEQEANAAFIAAADPTTLIALIKRIRELEAVSNGR